MQDHDADTRTVVRICFYNSKRQAKSFWNGARYVPFVKTDSDPDCTVIVSDKSIDSILMTRSETCGTILPSAPELGRIYCVDSVDDTLIRSLDAIEEEHGDVIFIADITNATSEQAFRLSYASMLFDMMIYRRNNDRGGYTNIPSMPQIVLLNESEGSIIRKYRDRRFTARDLLEDPDVLNVPNLTKAQRSCKNLSKFGLITQHENPSRRRGNSENKYSVDESGIAMERINRRIVNGKMNGTKRHD